MPRKKYDSRKVNIVGDFFEDLTEAMFIDIERAPEGEGDFRLWSIGTGMEVKGSDNNHEVRLPLKQIEEYQKISCGFPFETFFFLLFLYDNPYVRENGARVTSMSRVGGLLDIRGFLASSQMTLFMVEAALLPYLFSVGRISDKSIPLHRGVESLNLKQKHLNLMVNGGLGLIAEHGANFKVAKFRVEVKFSKYVIEEQYRVVMDVVTVGWSKNVRKLVKCFNPKTVLIIKRA